MGCHTVVPVMRCRPAEGTSILPWHPHSPTYFYSLLMWRVAHYPLRARLHALIRARTCTQIHTCSTGITPGDWNLLRAPLPPPLVADAAKRELVLASWHAEELKQVRPQAKVGTCGAMITPPYLPRPHPQKATASTTTTQQTPRTHQSPSAPSLPHPNVQQVVRGASGWEWGYTSGKGGYTARVIGSTVDLRLNTGVPKALENIPSKVQSNHRCLQCPGCHEGPAKAIDSSPTPAAAAVALVSHVPRPNTLYEG